MEWIKYIIRAIIIVFLQMLLFNHLHIGSWGFPMVYILCLMNLPVQIPRWLEVIIGAVLGLIIDIFNNSLGVNMAACTAFGLLRPIILSTLVIDVERVKGEICSKNLGSVEYIRCLVSITFIHHFLVFTLESLSWHNWWMVILQTLISSILTILLIVGYDSFR